MRFPKAPRHLSDSGVLQSHKWCSDVVGCRTRCAGQMSEAVSWLMLIVGDGGEAPFWSQGAVWFTRTATNCSYGCLERTGSPTVTVTNMLAYTKREREGEGTGILHASFSTPSDYGQTERGFCSKLSLVAWYVHFAPERSVSYYMHRCQAEDLGYDANVPFPIQHSVHSHLCVCLLLSLCSNLMSGSARWQ